MPHPVNLPHGRKGEKIGILEPYYLCLQKSCFLLGQCAWSGCLVSTLLAAIKALCRRQLLCKIPHLLSCWTITHACSFAALFFSPHPLNCLWSIYACFPRSRIFGGLLQSAIVYLDNERFLCEEKNCPNAAKCSKLNSKISFRNYKAQFSKSPTNMNSHLDFSGAQLPWSVWHATFQLAGSGRLEPFKNLVLKYCYFLQWHLG